MVLSAKVTSRVANSAAVRSRFVWWAIAASSAIAFQVFQIGGAQNLPTTVSSAVLIVLVSWPRLLTSLSARAYASLVRAGGGAGRNWSPLRSTNGITWPQLV